MLIEFNVTNFRSIRETQSLTMTASKYYKEHVAQNSFETGIPGMPRLLRSAVIYGPNAAGKSTLVMALSFMKTMVIDSAKESQEGEDITVTPFRLDASTREKESEFEIFFVEDSVRYQYGFTVNKTRVLREWMIAYPKGRPQHWFEREYDESEDQDNYVFGEMFLGGRRRDDWKQSTRKNALFFSTAILLNNEQLKYAFHWFQNRLTVLKPHTQLGPGYTAVKCEAEKSKNEILDFLNTADLGIADIIVKRSNFLDKLKIELPVQIRDQMKKAFEGKEIFDIKFVHKLNDSNENVVFDSDDESDGTRNLFSFAGPWLDVIEHDKVLVVDELDTSLHPKIVHHLIELLHFDGIKHAQILFTTHDTTILSQPIMRRDQIWFVDKKDQSTQLYPFSDFKVREKEAWEKAYLHGRYGAIPLTRTVMKHGDDIPITRG